MLTLATRAMAATGPILFANLVSMAATYAPSEPSATDPQLSVRCRTPARATESRRHASRRLGPVPGRHGVADVVLPHRVDLQYRTPVFASRSPTFSATRRLGALRGIIDGCNRCSPSSSNAKRQSTTNASDTCEFPAAAWSIQSPTYSFW